MANKRDRSRKKSRRPPFRDPKPRILVLCEGKNTEPQYLKQFTDACANPRVSIEIRGDEGATTTIVRSAKEMREENRRNANRVGDDNILFDAVWCVYDVDSHHYPKQAIDLARSSNIKLAISNECFELWLLLHFRDNPGAQNRQQLKRLLKKFVPKYDKHIILPDYLEGYPDAVRRAKRMWEDAADAREAWERNPVTNVFELTEDIRENSDLSQ